MSLFYFNFGIRAMNIINKKYFHHKPWKQKQSPVGGDCYHTILNSIFKTELKSSFMPIVGAMAIAPYHLQSLSARFYFIQILFDGRLKPYPTDSRYKFYYKENSIAKQAVSQLYNLLWGHNILIVQKTLYYINKINPLSETKT